MHDFKEQNGYGYENEIKAVLHGLGFEDADFDRPVSSLSGGQKTRLALAKLLLEKRDLLILDEPTNHLDIDTLTWLEGYIQNYTGALLIVSHDRYFLDRIVNEVYEISHHKSSHYTGNYSQYIKEKDARLKAQWKAYEKQQAEISHLEDFVNKNIVRASQLNGLKANANNLIRSTGLNAPKDMKKARILNSRVIRKAATSFFKLKTEPLVMTSKFLLNQSTLSCENTRCLPSLGQTELENQLF